MIAIAVDDEPLMLGALVKAIKASDDITDVTDFTSCDDALDFIKSNPVDIAFLVSICVAWEVSHLQKKLSAFVRIARLYFAPVMRNMLSLHLKFMLLVI